MSNSEIKKWAKEKIKGNIWKLLAAILVAGILTGLAIGNTRITEHGVEGNSVSLGWLFYFVEVGLAYYMVKFITDKEFEFTDIFAFAKDFGRCIGACLLQALYILLWALLLIIPGIMKAYSYALVPYLMADDKYKDLKISELLRKSEEMMKGHRWDYFCLQLSFIGWILLTPLTLGLLLIWLAPYMKTSSAKFLNDLKTSLE